MPRVRNEQREYIPRQIKYAVVSDCNYICAHCGKSIRDHRDQTLEHVIPLNKGGTNEISNFVALCYDCNKAKSDDIIEPKDYYPYLPSEKLKQVQAVFDDYIKNTRWLANDTLFKTDQFVIEVPMFIHKLRGNPIPVKQQIQLRKMRNNEIIEFLSMYGGRLDWQDKAILIYDEKKIKTSYYCMTLKDKVLGVITPYMQKINSPTPAYPKPIERNALHLDMFANPELRVTDGNIELLENLTAGVMKTIRETLKHHAPDTIIEFMIRCPNSDKLMHAVLDWSASIPCRNLQTFTACFGQNPELSASIYIASGMLYQGNVRDKKHHDALFSQNDLLEYRLHDLQKPIDEELKLSRAIGAEEKRLPTKKEKKKAKKKPKKRKH